MVDISKNFAITQAQPADQIDRLQAEERLETLPVTTRVRHTDKVDTSIKAKKETPQLFQVSKEIKRAGVITNADILKQAVEKAEATARTQRAFLRRMQEEEAATPSPITVAIEKSAEQRAQQNQRMEKAAEQKANIAKALEGKDDSQEKLAAQRRAVVEASKGQGNATAKAQQTRAQGKAAELKKSIAEDQAREIQRKQRAEEAHRAELARYEQAQAAERVSHQVRSRSIQNSASSENQLMQSTLYAARQGAAESGQYSRETAIESRLADLRRSARTSGAQQDEDLSVPDTAAAARAAESEGPTTPQGTDPSVSRAAVRDTENTQQKSTIEHNDVPTALPQPLTYPTHRSSALQQIQSAMDNLDKLVQTPTQNAALNSAPASSNVSAEPPPPDAEQQLAEDSNRLDAIRTELGAGIEAMELFSQEVAQQPALAREAEPLLRAFADKLTTARQALQEIGARHTDEAADAPMAQRRGISVVNPHQAQTLSQQIAQDIRSLAKSQSGVQPSAVAQLLL